MLEESLVGAYIVLLLIQVDTVFHEFLVFVVLHHLLDDVVARLGIHYLAAFLVQRRDHGQLVSLEPIVVTLAHSSAGNSLVNAFSHQLVVVLLSQFLITNHTCPIIGFCGFGSQRLLDSSTSGCEIRCFGLHVALSVFDSRIFLCEAADTHEHQRCQNQ